MSDSIQPILTTSAIPPAAAGVALDAMYVHLAVSDPEVLLAASELPEGRARTNFFLTVHDAAGRTQREHMPYQSAGFAIASQRSMSPHNL